VVLFVKTEVQYTKDGSTTLYVPELKEHYHSVNGAVQESIHVFINNGLHAHTGTAVRIFEMGFGTGLNTWLTFMHKDNKTVYYDAIEYHPLSAHKINALNYTDSYRADNVVCDMFSAIHTTAWDQPHQLCSTFFLNKITGQLQQFVFTEMYDIIYFDAFAPSVQPEVWGPEIFQRVAQAMNPNGLLVTYCAKGSVRRDLQSAGLHVDRLPGPPGKREMIRAVKKA
jgi:tRNA U34 5-methylaminomethyl-2-thiouridine-forming methyltransferase MnmC